MSRTVRKAYTKSKRFDKTCRNHGACSYCRDTRLYQFNKEKQRVDSAFNNYEKEREDEC